MSAMILMTLMAAASAQDESPSPLAVPIQDARPATPSPVTQRPVTQRPLAVPAPVRLKHPSPPTAAQLQALRQYRRERLAVHPELEIRGGGTQWQTGFSAVGPSWGWGMAVADPISTTRTWGIYKGADRLDVPDFLEEVGALELKYTLDQDIQRARRNSRAWYALAGAGVAGILVGSIGANSAGRTPGPEARFEEYVYTNVVFASIGTTVLGLFAGSFPAARAERLTNYPSASLTIDRAQRLADEHNETLRQDLDLSPEAVWDIESRAESRR
ncbi:MAG: hypothetical protein AAFV53_37505 [Myxococcota bacterium]